MDHRKQAVVAELGRTQTVKDVEAAWQQIVDADHRRAMKMRHARQDKQALRTEVELFLDDVKQITGLGEDSPIFWAIVGKTLGLRLRRHRIKDEEDGYREMCGPLAEFADDAPMKDLPGDDDFADAICKVTPEMRKYRR